MINTTQLVSLLPTEDYKGLSDAEVAAKASIPIGYDAFTGTVTYTTLGSTKELGDSWGVDAAVIFHKQMMASKGSDDSLGYFNTCLGIGLNPTDPDARTAALKLVVAKFITQEQMDAIFGLPIYLCGDVVTEDDVATARVIVEDQKVVAARQNELRTLRVQIEQWNIRWVALLDAANDPKKALPGMAELAAVLEA